MAPRRLPARRRAAAWVVTGPLGHLYGGLADWALLAGRLAAAKAGRRRAAASSARAQRRV